MTWEFGMVIGFAIGMIAALFILDGPLQPTYQHVTLTRERPVVESAFGGYTLEECKEQVRRGEFLDNDLHYCRRER